LDDATKRQIGIWILIVTGAFGWVLLEHISYLNWSPSWIWFIGIVWYASEAFLGFLIYHFFKVTKADVPGTVILTKTETKSVHEGPDDENAKTNLSSDDEGIIDK